MPTQGGFLVCLLAVVFGGRSGNAMDAPTLVDVAGDETVESQALLHAGRREKMVSHQIRARGITDASVLAAMLRVPRRHFVADRDRDRAHADHPLPIGHGQTISQPYIVALMTELAEVKPGERVLDIGTGSGYQAAILSEIVGRVYSIEIVEALAESARRRLDRLGYKQIEVRAGDGYRGWPEHAPFDAIIVAAAPNKIPQPLIDQLSPGGRLVIPVGDFLQQLVVIEKLEDGSVRRKSVTPVRFVPMTGEAELRH
jgi:protein-L-isoaspartate(D-aspartate) O-methyltransferase